MQICTKSLDNLWNHFVILIHKVFSEFKILVFHDFFDKLKITKCGGYI